MFKLWRRAFEMVAASAVATAAPAQSKRCRIDHFLVTLTGDDQIVNKVGLRHAVCISTLSKAATGALSRK